MLGCQSNFSYEAEYELELCDLKIKLRSTQITCRQEGNYNSTIYLSNLKSGYTLNRYACAMYVHKHTIIF